MYSPFDIIKSMSTTEYAKALRGYIDDYLKARNQSMYEASRTGTVMAVGALGIGGLAGMAASGLVGGIVVDGVTTYVTGEPHGIIGVANDARKKLAEDPNKIPSEPLIQGALIAATDAISGLEGGEAIYSIRGAINTAVNKTTSIGIMKTLISHETRKSFLQYCQNQIRGRSNDKPHGQ